jgi:iduronate 2-sulfatase
MFKTRRTCPLASVLALTYVTLLSGPCIGAERRPEEAASGRLNVLFIAIDDLRPQLHCYGREEMVTPNLDNLAAESRLFEHHYVQVPTCGASRCALLTGRYPDRPEAYDNDAFGRLPREESQAAASLPQLFRTHGYRTVSIGKVTHSPDGAREDGEAELPFSWDEFGVPSGKWRSGWSAFFAYADGSTRVPGMTPATEHADVPDDGYPDGLIAEAAITKLNELKDRPFFLAVGFFKPHLPFNSPDRYWDLYAADTVPAARYTQAPKNVDPEISLHKSSELTPRYTGLAQPGVVTTEEGAHLRHAYASCVSYVDAQVGRVLAELRRLGLDKNTVVVVWGDHGWHLGEHGIWGKHTLHEVALRSPLIVLTPGMAAPGESASGIVEAVDLYPTLAELCGLVPPGGIDGRSFARMLNDPHAPGKPAAFGFWAAGRAHSVRTARYRFTRWTAPHEPTHVIQAELYDHDADPEETVNIAADHPDLVQELDTQLHQKIPLLRDAGLAPSR